MVTIAKGQRQALSGIPISYERKPYPYEGIALKERTVSSVVSESETVSGLQKIEDEYRQRIADQDTAFQAEMDNIRSQINDLDNIKSVVSPETEVAPQRQALTEEGLSVSGINDLFSEYEAKGETFGPYSGKYNMARILAGPTADNPFDPTEMAIYRKVKGLPEEGTGPGKGPAPTAEGTMTGAPHLGGYGLTETEAIKAIGSPIPTKNIALAPLSFGYKGYQIGRTSEENLARLNEIGGMEATEPAQPALFGTPGWGMADEVGSVNTGWTAVDTMGENAFGEYGGYADAYGEGSDAGEGGGDGSACIIVTSCTDPFSHEVDITRRFRDKYLSDETLKGYYKLAKQIVPLINKSRKFKDYIKRFLVDRLIDFGEWFMGYKCNMRYPDSMSVTTNFLKLCNKFGRD